MSSPEHDPHPIHFLYRLVFNFIEPILALGGTIQIFFAPLSYFAISHQNLNTILSRTPSTVTDSLQTIFTCVAGGWFMLAINDLVTLRKFQYQPEVWWYVIIAHLASDALYLLALKQDLGSWARVVDVGMWDSGEWITNVLTWPFTLAKVLFLLGIGVRFDARAAAGKGHKA
jgi:hypothetical protein